jgi:hypothetical protein
MTDDQNTENGTMTEKQLLMQRARLMGIKFSNNITEDALRAKIAEKLGGENDGEADDDAEIEDGSDDEVDQVDEDGDGHDDNTGQFVDGNQEAADGAQERDPGVTSLSGQPDIAAALAAAPAEPETPAPAPTPAPVAERPNPLLDTPTAAPVVDDTAPPRRLSKVEAKNALRHKLIRESMALVRCRITNLNPSKKDLPGEIFTVANRFIGTVRKYVPYGEVTDNGYHLPKCIYDQLVERRFQNIRTVKDKRTGTPRVDSSWAKEFAIEVLPQLTEQELKDLALAQAAAGSID